MSKINAAVPVEDFISPTQSNHQKQNRSDYNLQKCRRLDWRFLLSEPNLNHIACSGIAPKSLIDALQKFGESLTIIPPSALSSTPDLNSNFDLLVLYAPVIQQLQCIKPWVKPAGYIYIELSGESIQRYRRNQNRTKSSFSDYIDVLEKAGFDQIQFYWHRPNFEKCLEIIPIKDEFTLQYYFSRPAGDLQSWLKLAGGRILMKSGLIQHAIKSISVVARKRP